ncbi:zinc finger protein-domain-containing protein [Dactylonectria macrodidyma]|uniref:Zinc finger protein-domain-containing protein n=1 Tax=Dactylonectria macrodidyma TaxID=307937 RepID=A0A9P9FA08_9HYPO|nr:zinc finger protein-domain-containing protein [Dactylonectria macrodidyma]
MASRRAENISEESTNSQLSVGLKADIEATNLLSEQLDNARNEELKKNAHISDTDSELCTLTRLLSLRSETSTTSSFATFQQQMRFTEIGFRKIGFGQCGLVFERPGQGFVIKVAKPGFKDALTADYQVHQAVSDAFRRQKTALECRVPQVYKHIPATDFQWWNEHQTLFLQQHEDFPIPAAALMTERILPLPKIARHGLITQFCDKAMQADAVNNHQNRDCLARIYLGKRLKTNAPLQRNFSLRNFNLHLDQMLALELPVEDYARAIAEALAVIHWDANSDAYDIEYVLGSEAAVVSDTTTLDFKTRTIRIWVLDFNLCSRWEEAVGWQCPEALIDQLVFAFFENDPYYPLPLMENGADQKLWGVFRERYLAKAQEVLSGKDKRLNTLPAKFIDSCVAREQGKLEKGLGHGHRDFKATQWRYRQHNSNMHSVLHDWNDETCLKILNTIMEAMKPGYSKLLINENVIPETGAQWEATALDIMMLTLLASRERTRENWETLLGKAGLKIVKVWTVANGVESLIECELF